VGSHPLVSSPETLTGTAYGRWHEHDPEEIQGISEQCITQACAKLEEAGWAKESVKVIGTCVHPIQKVLVLHELQELQTSVKPLWHGVELQVNLCVRLSFGPILVQRTLSLILSTCWLRPASR
jgi:hypothetical protein